MRTYSKEPHPKQEGGILLELIIFAFLLALFTAGTAQVHSAFGRRHQAIVRDRNEAIRHARGKIFPSVHVPDGG